MNNVVLEKEIDGYKIQVFSKKPDFEIIQVDQVHGPVVLKDQNLKDSANEADGLYTHDLKLPLAIKTADCLPIFVIGKKGASLLHAGWRGVHQKIVLASELKEIEPYYFFIGPFIQKEHFLVQEEFRSNFPKSKHFKVIEGKLFFDLGAETIDQIKSSYSNAQIEISPLSTFNDDRFHSYRKDGTKERNWNVLSKIK